MLEALLGFETISHGRWAMGLFPKRGHQKRLGIKQGLCTWRQGGPTDGRWRMEVRVEGKCGPLVKNVDEVLRQIQQQLKGQQEQWVAQLRDHPAQFADLEARIHQTFQGLADQVVAGVLAQVTAADDFAQDAKKK